jgi:hypothetical protein
MNEFRECCCISNEEAHKILKEMEYEANINKWISVKDRLPDEDGYYLVYIIANFCSENKQIITLYFSKLSKRFIYGSDEIFTVTHWAQLPEPPKEDNANGKRN